VPTSQVANFKALQVMNAKRILKKKCIGKNNKRDVSPYN
jgi:hypothetical protein